MSSKKVHFKIKGRLQLEVSQILVKNGTSWVSVSPLKSKVKDRIQAVIGKVLSHTRPYAKKGSCGFTWSTEDPLCVEVQEGKLVYNLILPIDCPDLPVTRYIGKMKKLLRGVLDVKGKGKKEKGGSCL